MRLLALLFLLCGNIYAENLPIAGPFSGLNNEDSSITIDASEAQDTLNVEVSNDLLALNKRAGYTLSSNLTVSTSPITGSVYFKTSTGDNIKIFTHDKYVSKSVNGGAYTNIITTAANGAKWSFCASAGVVYAFNDNHATPWSYNGTAITYYPSMPLASLCSMTVDRMLLAGTTDQPNRLYFSQSGAITNFTVGTDPEDPGFEDIGLAGEKITNIFATQAEWLIFKTNSFTSLQGTNQFDLVPSVISEKIGMIEPHAIVQHEGIVYFKSTDGKIYGYNSGTVSELSKKISGFVTGITRDAVSSAEYTTKAQFDTGTYYASTGSVTAGSVEPFHYISEDTSDADFNAGTIAGSSITVSGDEITINNFPTGEFPNIGAEMGDTTNWTGSFLTADTTLKYWGNYSLKRTHNVSSSFIGCMRILDINGDTLYTSGTQSSASPFSIDIGTYPAQIKIAVAISASGGACNTVITSPVFNRPDTLTYYLKGSCLSSCNGNPLNFDMSENIPVVTSATFISQVFTNTSSPTHYGYFTSTKTVPANTQIDFFLRSSTATTGTFTGWYSTTDYLLITSTDTVWQYKANFYNTASYSKPSIQSAGILFKTTGYWETPEISMGGVSNWGLFNAETTLTGVSTQTYKIYVATYAGGTANATAELIVPGTLISASTGTYAKVRATNYFQSATETVKLDSINLSWSRLPDKMANAFEYKGDIYFSVPYSDSLSNNRVLKLDIGSGGWNVFDIPLNSPLSIDEYVYFGSPTTYSIYQYPSGNTDNGAAINSYWKSKNFIGSNPYVDKQWERLSLVVGSDYGSNLDVTYTLDTATSTSYTISLTSTTADFVRNNRQLPLGDTGSFFNLRIGNNSTTPWRFFGASIDYILNPWRVEE